MLYFPAPNLSVTFRDLMEIYCLKVTYSQNPKWGQFTNYGKYCNPFFEPIPCCPVTDSCYNYRKQNPDTVLTIRYTCIPIIVCAH